MRKQQRIGLVLSHLPGYSETFFKNKIKGLQDHGIEVVLFTIEPSKPVTSVLNCKVVQAPYFKGSVIKTFITSVLVLLHAFLFTPRICIRHFRLDRLDGFGVRTCIKRLIQNAFLFQEQLDWLHFGFGMLAVDRENVAKAIDAKMAVSFRGFDLYLSPLKHPNCYDLLFEKDVCYHVLSQEMAEDLMAFDIPKHHIFVITPAIDVDFFSSEKVHVQSVNKPILQIVTVARLHWKKGLEYTLEALALLKQQGIAFKYTIIGEGDDYERLVFAAHQLGVKDNVFFTGKLKPKAVKTYLTQSDIYLQYSIQEGFCNAVLEAQAMGLLCIVSNAEGLSENVLHNETGWVVPKRRPDLLAAQIKTVIKLSLEDQHSVSERAVKRVQSDFNLKQQQYLFLKFYYK